MTADQGGAMTAWEQVLDDLVRVRGRALVRYATLLTGDDREGEDLVQDALVRCFGQGRPLRETGAAEAYVRKAVLVDLPRQTPPHGPVDRRAPPARSRRRVRRPRADQHRAARRADGVAHAAPTAARLRGAAVLRRPHGAGDR